MSTHSCVLLKGKAALPNNSNEKYIQQGRNRIRTTLTWRAGDRIKLQRCSPVISPTNTDGPHIFKLYAMPVRNAVYDHPCVRKTRGWGRIFSRPRRHDVSPALVFLGILPTDVRAKILPIDQGVRSHDLELLHEFVVSARDSTLKGKP